MLRTKFRELNLKFLELKSLAYYFKNMQKFVALRGKAGILSLRQQLHSLTKYMLQIASIHSILGQKVS